MEQWWRVAQPRPSVGPGLLLCCIPDKWQLLSSFSKHQGWERDNEGLVPICCGDAVWHRYDIMWVCISRAVLLKKNRQRTMRGYK